ncbi:MAG: hypothetical protein M1840_000835 [Geoglossum simile]|nr:MAG: hypothetical protein M1840_000835 [Geoglossum simile]
MSSTIYETLQLVILHNAQNEDVDLLEYRREGRVREDEAHGQDYPRRSRGSK